MSKSNYANGEAPPGEQHKAVQTAAWSELVGFRRRDAASAEPVKPVGPEASKSDAVVIIGKGANIVGEITNCSQVEIAGALEGKVVAESVVVRAGGYLKGHVRAERAEVHGSIEGQVQVEDHLDIRSTGVVAGELAYGKLSVASGGRLAGTIEIVSDAEHESHAAGGMSFIPAGATSGEGYVGAA
jgi:cytoskeletal protein CcmA (bactofilin family)